MSGLDQGGGRLKKNGILLQRQTDGKNKEMGEEEVCRGQKHGNMIMRPLETEKFVSEGQNEGEKNLWADQARDV